MRISLVIRDLFKKILKIRLHIVRGNTDIVILDDYNAHYLEKVASKYSCLYLRRGYYDLYVSLLTPIYFIFYFVKLKKVYKSAYLASIRVINPMLCLTYIDNSEFVFLTSNYLQPIRTIAIQNGQRTCFNTAMPNLIGKTIDTFVSFGCLEVDEYKRVGIDVINHVPFGSLKNVLYKTNKNNNLPSSISPYILYVSQFRKERLMSNHKTIDNYHKIITNAIKVAKILKVELQIMLVNKRGEGEYFDEIKWYKEYGFKMSALIDNDKVKLKAYDIIENAQLLIGFTSTLLREGFGRGKKTLFVNYTGDHEYDFPVQGLWKLVNPSDTKFINSAIELYQMPVDQYNDIACEAAEYVMLNPDSLDMLSNIIDGYIENVVPYKYLKQHCGNSSKFSSPGI